MKIQVYNNYCATLQAYHLSQLEGRPPHATQSVDYPLQIGIVVERVLGYQLGAIRHTQGPLCHLSSCTKTKTSCKT